MEVNFFNTKMKKLIIALMICVLTFSYIYPCVVFAESTTTYSLKEAVDYIMDNTKNNITREKAVSLIKSKLLYEFNKNLDNQIPNVDYYYDVYKTNKTMISVSNIRIVDGSRGDVNIYCDIELFEYGSPQAIAEYGEWRRCVSVDEIGTKNPWWESSKYLQSTFDITDDTLIWGSWYMKSGYRYPHVLYYGGFGRKYSEWLQNAANMDAAVGKSGKYRGHKVEYDNFPSDIKNKVTNITEVVQIRVKDFMSNEGMDDISNKMNNGENLLVFGFFKSNRRGNWDDFEVRQVTWVPPEAQSTSDGGNNGSSPGESNGNTSGASSANELYEAYVDSVETGENNGIESVGEMFENEENNDDTDVGGILLKPIFGLVNFVLDAITAIFRNLMTGTSGFTVMSTTTTPKETGEDAPKYFDYVINMDAKCKLTTVKYPTITYSPEEIFSGTVPILSVDFISNENGNTDNGWLSIRAVIAQWYKALRMMAIIGLLSVLIYTGIKILISSNAKDKAKYKEWIINWIMAVAILFAMHIIMAFIISITNQISEMISHSAKIAINNNGTVSVTNLMGLVRFMVQADSFGTKIGYEVLYVMLIVYTFKFTFVYLKRVLNMAFLTLIAPIVAFTYPIDKLNDGKAQGFDMWLKEYIFNALLQPMHYIMYYVLLSSAIGIAAKNPLYGIAVLAFMSEAEKLLKKIFGFDKAKGGTVGGMASAFAAGAVASNIAKMAKLPPKGNAGGPGGGGAGGQELLAEGIRGNLQGMDEFTGEDDNANEKKDKKEEKLDANQVAGERQALEELKAEGINGDKEAAIYEEYEKEVQAKEEKLRQQQALEQENKPEDKPEETAEDKPENKPIDSGTPIREMSKAKKIGNGVKAVAGKAWRKTIYDGTRSGKYNARRWARRIGNVGKAALGVGMGITAAAVQAGISLTDGKYNPMEGIAAFSAGFAGGSRLADGTVGALKSLGSTYSNAANAGDESVKLKRMQDRFEDREDVRQFNEKNFAGREKEAMERQRDNYLSAGVTDLKEMKSGMKYADSLMKNNPNLSKEKADRRAAATIEFQKQLQSQGQSSAVYDKDKREKYIQTMVDNASDADKEKVRKQYENAFKSVVALNKANE